MSETSRAQSHISLEATGTSRWHDIRACLIFLYNLLPRRATRYNSVLEFFRETGQRSSMDVTCPLCWFDTPIAQGHKWTVCAWCGVVLELSPKMETMNAILSGLFHPQPPEVK
jgi:hypothetical protein